MNDAPGLHHNNPPIFETLSAEADGLLVDARERCKAPLDAAMADLLGKTTGDLRAIAKRLDAAFEEEKRPHLEAGRAVDEKWRGIRQSVKTAIDFIGKRLSDYLAEQNRLRREAEAKARAEAEEKQRAAEAAEAKAKQSGDLNATLAAQKAMAQADEAAAEAKTLKGSAKVGGGDGARAVSMRKFYSAQIVNKKAALNFFSNDKRIIDALQACADEACRKTPNDPPPGVKTHIEERAV